MDVSVFCSFICLCSAAQEACVCIPGEVCRRAAGLGFVVHQHLPAGPEGNIWSSDLSLKCVFYWWGNHNIVWESLLHISFMVKVSCELRLQSSFKSFGCSNNTVFFSWQDPNQFIRASALRVLSSVRVPIIVPIMMLAIKEAASDMSPYVRKTSAHAIQKLYRYLSLHLTLLLFFFIYQDYRNQWNQ